MGGGPVDCGFKVGWNGYGLSYYYHVCSSCYAVLFRGRPNVGFGYGFGAECGEFLTFGQYSVSAECGFAISA